MQVSKWGRGPRENITIITKDVEQSSIVLQKSEGPWPPDSPSHLSEALTHVSSSMPQKQAVLNNCLLQLFKHNVGTLWRLVFSTTLVVYRCCSAILYIAQCQKHFSFERAPTKQRATNKFNSTKMWNKHFLYKRESLIFHF